MKKNLCSLTIQNLKNVTRIVGNNIIPGKSIGVVHFTDIQQVKLALKLQESNNIVIQSEIPTDILKELEPDFPQQKQPVEPVVEKVQAELEPVVEEVVEAKPKRKKKNS